MGEAYPQSDNVLPLVAFKAKLSTFSSHCNDLLHESVCLVGEIAKFADFACLFAPLNLALEEFLREQPRFDAFLNEHGAACSQGQYEEELRSGNSAQFGITKEEDAVSEPEVDVACPEKFETVAIALPKLRVRLQNSKAVRRVKSDRTMKLRPPKAVLSKPKTANKAELGRSSSHRKESRFWCHTCDTRLKAKRSLQRHMILMHSGEKYSCTECGYETKLIPELEYHRISGDCGLTFQCAICGRVKSNRASFYRHLKTHTARFACHICQARLKSKATLLRHVRNHSRDGLSFVCDRCGFKTNKRGIFRLHLARYCKPDKALKCEVCAACAKTVRTLESHMAREHADMPDLDCAACGFKTKIEDVYQRHVRSFCKANVEKPFQCEICNIRLKQKRNMDRHMEMHLRGDKELVCERCGFKTKARGIFDRHVAHWCDTRTVFQCAVCGSVKGGRISLQDHLRMVHSGHPYMCEICSQRSKTISKHNEHMKIHSGEKKWVCEMCGFRSFSSVNLKIHMESHSERNVRCPYEGCDGLFKTKNYLRVHIRRTHKKAKPCQCPQCEMAFTSPCQLKRHMVKHTGEKPFDCPVCGQAFSRRTSLRVHIQCVHKLSPRELVPIPPKPNERDFPGPSANSNAAILPAFSVAKGAAKSVLSSRRTKNPNNDFSAVNSSNQRPGSLSNQREVRTSFHQIPGILTNQQTSTASLSNQLSEYWVDNNPGPSLSLQPSKNPPSFPQVGETDELTSFCQPQILDYSFLPTSAQFWT